MKAPLSGVRTWLSGSYPGTFPVSGPDADYERFSSFVRKLARIVFRDGGSIIHGSHPSIRDVLLEAAAEYRAAKGQKALLTLCVSEFYMKDARKNDIDEAAWKEVAEVVVVPEAVADRGKANGLGKSLDALRDRMAGSCDVVIGLGGRWWDVAGSDAGVPSELSLGLERGLPCFMLPCFGGATAEFLNSRLEMLAQCQNGLSPEQNLELAAISDPDILLKRVMKQIELLPVRRRDLSGRTFRILSLDGGGIRGAFTAAVLARWESRTGFKVADYFDLIAGTSTGGILAIGLGLGINAQDIVEFYRLSGPKIFPADTKLQELKQSFVHWLDSKFDGTALNEELTKAYANAPRGGESLAKSRCRLLIPSYDSYSDQLQLFRTPHFPFQTAAGVSDPVVVAQSTAAAPTYFAPVFATGGVAEVKAIDGGVWANCPGPAALAEAVGNLGIPLDRIRMLSIGTTFNPALYGKSGMSSGAVGWLGRMLKQVFTGDDADLNGKIAWAANIAPFLMKTQAQTAEHICQLLLASGRFLRVDAASTATTLDDVDSMNELFGLGTAEADKHFDAAKLHFLNGTPADDWKRS